MKIVHICLCGAMTDGFNYQENVITKYHKKMGYDVTIIASQWIWNSAGKLQKMEKTDYINQTEKRYYIVMAMITVASIVMGLLLAWTPVGTGVSLGVQGRYFLPLVVPFFLAFNKGASRFQGCGKYLPAAYALTLMVFSICLITRF